MKKLKCFGYSLLPLLLWITAESAVVSGCRLGIPVLWKILSGMGLESSGLAEYITREYGSIVSVLADSVFLVCGFVWFRRLKERENGNNGESAAFSPKAGVSLFFLGIAVQFGTSAVLMVIQTLSPETVESHSRTLESLGMFSPTLWSVLYMAVIAPMAEELLCRGLTLKLLERAFPFGAANFLQALCFGLIHGNLIQGTYAFLAGMLFGMTVRKYRTLKAAVFLHSVVNISGILLGNISLNIGYRILTAAVCTGFTFLFTEKHGNR